MVNVLIGAFLAPPLKGRRGWGMCFMSAGERCGARVGPHPALRDFPRPLYPIGHTSYKERGVCAKQKKKRADQSGLPVNFIFSGFDYWKDAMAGWISL